MTETQVKDEYGIREAKPSIPSRNLLVVPHRDTSLVLSHPAFGPNYFRTNIDEMRKQYFHSAEVPVMTFRPATTSESISAANYKFTNLTKPQIFDSNWLQLGWIVRTSEGVFANPLDLQGNPVTDLETLSAMRDKAEEFDGVYLGKNDFGFAPYESFSREAQDCDTFVQGGLARVLEHVRGNSAPNLRAIASPKHYKNGVNVWGFDPVKEPVLRVVGLCSDRFLDVGRLDVYGCGGSWDSGRYGFAFGVCLVAEGDARKK